MKALHIAKSGTRTYCGRHVGVKDRMTVRGTPLSYWTACDTMHRYGCYSCSDNLWAKLGGGPFTNQDKDMLLVMRKEAAAMRAQNLMKGVS